MRRAVLTGIGVVAPGGVGTKPFWEQITSGRSATRPVTLFDATGYRSRIAGEVDFDPVAAGLRPEQAEGLDRMVQFALVALREALDDSGLPMESPAPHRIGVSIGTAVGCTMGLESQYATVSSSGRDWLVDHTRAVGHLFDFFVPTSLSREVAWAAGAEGPAAVVSTGCTSGLDAVGYALDLILDGTADVMITGASDAPLSPITYACFDALRATSPDNDDPAGACRPFDLTRNGFALGEGAAVFVLEEYEHARRRGAHVHAELAGFATRCNAYHMTGLSPDGLEMAEAIDAAMRQARMAPDDLDYINAHGSGTRQNDLHETAAFKHALGLSAYGIPVSSIKSMIGHSLGSVGSLEIAACALAIEHGVIPPTANLRVPDPECDLDYVPLVARETRVDAALTVGSGFGGFQSAAVLRRSEAV
ncbi:beta-ketoacyl-[acyl-carrier-protein] synthase family protein [Streptomyces iranensis]|uniref:Act minimal PKS ketosynthase (KS/KS alpha) n=1 Tax=Streptomyces iranensis TaxID=576784 RepID=A0A060ZK05_9ACTN|nr:beta-ketoacyl-[acyl-carrier-protein] synthase family protein [Streptomyces iranensis]MBP2060872.1 act minimal PKS ketosynthase (KS/KS alpha) [Streptomyces iranensis]CDR06333.1 Beta-ketoacyl synthase [Streptomyces iranensis]